MTKTVTMMEKVTKIMINSRYSPISGMTCRQIHLMVTEYTSFVFEIRAISTEGEEGFFLTFFLFFHSVLVLC